MTLLKKPRALAVFVAALTLAACGLESSTDSVQSREDAVSAGQCVKIEGGDIGRLPQTINVGGVTITLVSWTAKSGSNGEYVGFAITSAGTVAFVVKAGTATFSGTGTSWINPNGTSGRYAKGISNITFCITAPPPPPPPEVDAGTPPPPPEECDAGTPPPPPPPEECDAGTPPPPPPPAVDAGSDCSCGAVIGTECTANAECAQNNCWFGVCAPGGHGVNCTSNNECLSGVCSAGWCTNPN